MYETPVTYCESCGWSDEKYVNQCPECGSTNVKHYRRKGGARTDYIV